MIDYKKSGVDIQAGDDLVSWLQNQNSNDRTPSEKNENSLFHSSSTIQKKYSDIPDLKSRVMSGIGGFSALFDGRFSHMEKPLLISCTDGVGTKVKLASYFNDYSTIGQDLVAMCVNDLICTGGTPLFFLDYYAVGKLDLVSAKSFLQSVRKACDLSHLVLIGGETAEMPGVYQNGDFDCAGFAVGVVDQNKMWGAHLVNEGDIIIGVQSSGYHSNGYSLLREIFKNEFEKHRSWLMEPTRLYVDVAFKLREFSGVKAVAHMTGGGIENLPRVFPDYYKAEVKKWELPEKFKFVQERSGMTDQQMRETLNCGIGLTIIVHESQANKIVTDLCAINYPAQILGKISVREEKEAHVVWT